MVDHYLNGVCGIQACCWNQFDHTKPRPVTGWSDIMNIGLENGDTIRTRIVMELLYIEARSGQRSSNLLQVLTLRWRPQMQFNVHWHLQTTHESFSFDLMSTGNDFTKQESYFCTITRIDKPPPWVACLISTLMCDLDVPSSDSC